MISTFPKWAFDLFITTIFAIIAIFCMNAFCYKPDLAGTDAQTAVSEWAEKSGSAGLSNAGLMRRVSQELLEKDVSAFKEPGQPLKLNAVAPESTLPGEIPSAKANAVGTASRTDA